MNLTKRITLCLCALFIGCNTLNAQWVKLNTDSLHAYCSIYFINSDTGFVSGTYSPYGPDGVILRTLDGGSTWDTTIVSNAGFLMDIQFINDSIGYAGGQDGSIFWTQDMGSSWNYHGNCQALDDITNFYFIQQDSALILDVFGRLNAYNSQICPNIINTQATTFFPGTGALNLTSASEGYLAGGKGKFLKTTNGGLNWSNYNCDSTLEILGATMFDANKAAAVGKFGKFAISNNGGNSWSQPVSISNHSLTDIEFIDINSAYCIGGKYKGNQPFAYGNGSIWETTDGGTTWVVDDTSFSDILNDLLIVNDSLSFAVGYSGLLLRKMTSIGSTGQAFLEQNNKSYSVYPIPFKENFTVSSNHQYNTPSIMKVFNQFGQVTHTQIVFDASQGIIVDAAIWPIGIYILTIQNDHFNLSYKLAKL